MKTSLSILIPLALMVLCVTLMGCDPKDLDEVTLFPHSIHTEQELTCDMCHVLEEGVALMPTFSVCMDCHDYEDEADSTFANCEECHSGSVEPTEESLFAHKDMVMDALPDNWGDVKYQHATFLDEEFDCAACHGNIAESDTLGLKNYPSMEVAMKAHDEWGFSNDCAGCHLELDKLTPPASHNSRWGKRHGIVSEFSDKDTCLMCHEEETCTTCHRTKKPRNHTSLFRRKTHGMKAAFDRSSCINCHREDQCMQCHQESAPTAHNAGMDCFMCHGKFTRFPHRFIAGANSSTCLECHRL